MPTIAIQRSLPSPLFNADETCQRNCLWHNASVACARATVVEPRPVGTKRLDPKWWLTLHQAMVRTLPPEPRLAAITLHRFAAACQNQAKATCEHERRLDLAGATMREVLSSAGSTLFDVFGPALATESPCPLVLGCAFLLSHDAFATLALASHWLCPWEWHSCKAWRSAGFARNKESSLAATVLERTGNNEKDNACLMNQSLHECVQAPGPKYFSITRTLAGEPE